MNLSHPDMIKVLTYRRVKPRTPEWEQGVRYFVNLACGHTIALAKGLEPQLKHTCFFCKVGKKNEPS